LVEADDQTPWAELLLRAISPGTVFSVCVSVSPNAKVGTGVAAPHVEGAATFKVGLFVAPFEETKPEDTFAIRLEIIPAVTVADLDELCGVTTLSEQGSVAAATPAIACIGSKNAQDVTIADTNIFFIFSPHLKI